MTSQLNWQAPAINRKKVGDMTVTMLSDGYLDVSFELLTWLSVVCTSTCLLPVRLSVKVTASH